MSEKYTFAKSTVLLCGLVLAIKGAFATMKDLPAWWGKIMGEYRGRNL